MKHYGSWQNSDFRSRRSLQKRGGRRPAHRFRFMSLPIFLDNLLRRRTFSKCGMFAWRRR